MTIRRLGITKGDLRKFTKEDFQNLKEWFLNGELVFDASHLIMLKQMRKKLKINNKSCIKSSEATKISKVIEIKIKIAKAENNWKKSNIWRTKVRRS